MNQHKTEFVLDPDSGYLVAVRVHVQPLEEFVLRWEDPIVAEVADRLWAEALVNGSARDV